MLSECTQYQNGALAMNFVQKKKICWIFTFTYNFRLATHLGYIVIACIYKYLVAYFQHCSN